MRARKIEAEHGALHIDHPSYRVQFYSEPTACDEWQVDDIDVDQLLDWANDRRAGRAMTIWAVAAVAATDNVVAEVRLFGEDVCATAS